MEFPQLSIFILLSLAIVATHAALPPEVYWKSKLPTTPMLKAITDLLHPTGKPKGKSVQLVAPHIGFTYIGYAATKTQLNDSPNTALFFLKENLHPTTKFNLHFTKSSNKPTTFLPRDVAESIPFSSNKTEDILKTFSITEDSEKTEIVKNSIRECEESGIKGEEKRCVTSLESMVDFATSELGNNVDVVSTSTEANKETKLQEYEITSGVRKLTGDRVVVCHKQNYPYAVFYCHETGKTEAYFVPLEGVDGSRVKAIVVCHTDTKEWNPKHLAFQVLKVQPGTVPICHFLPEDHVVWVQK